MAKLMMPQIKDLDADSAKTQGWTAKPLSGQLGYIAKNMDVRNANYQKGNVSSIPDVWAKPRLFEMLLFGKNVNKEDGSGQSDVNLRQRVIGEWRCVLAMLALCKIKPSLQLEAEAVNIEKNGRTLEEIFLAVPPTDTVNKQTSWNKLYLLKYQGVPFAITSPTTLVSVAADYSGALKDGRGVKIGEPWAVKNVSGDIVLTDPTDNLDPSECYHIWFWVGKLLDNLRSCEGNDNVRENLCEQLEEYQRDLKDRFEEAGISQRELQMGEKYLNMTEGIFRYLDAPINPPAPQASDSFVKIQPSEGKNPEKLWLFVDTRYLREMAKAWNVDPNRMFIWGNTSINEINDTMLDDKKRNRIGETTLKYTVGENNDTKEKCCEWVRADDFFTEHLYIFEDVPNIFADVVFNPGANEYYSIVPPISKRLLEYFSIDYIQDNFKMEIRSGNTIVARFRLPFVYIDERGKEKDREFWLEKEYPEDIVGEYRRASDSYYAPVAEVWPNKRVYDNENKNVWNKYYFCFITPDCDGSTAIEEDILLLTPWSSATGETDWKGNSIQRANKYTVRLKEFPEALICRVLWKYSNSSKEEDVGVLIVKQPTEAATLTYNRTWEVGLDFGTSSTMLYYKQGSDKAKALSLHPNLFTIIDKGGDRYIPLLANFIKPFDDEISNGSFLSVYHPLKGNRKTERVEPLTEGHVLSLNAGQQESLMGAVENMVPNLKWSTKDGGRDDLQYKKKMVRAYIEQICLQTAFEAAMANADKIIWKFSYPTAFSSQEYTDFQDMVKEAVKKAMEDTPYALEGSLPGRYEMDNALWAESVASATYFKNQGKGNFANGAICLDIGAGTTDISVVSPQGSQILYHASVIYAGRIFFKPVFAWLENELSDGEATATGVSDEDKKKALLDAAMREKSTEKLRKVKDIISSGKDEEKETVEAMLQIPQLAMAGLFYYVGMLLKVLKEQNIFQGNTIPDIYIGGNGARIFHWFSKVSEDNDINSYHLNVLKEALLASSGFEEANFAIVMSGEPKAEVAAGMLAEVYNEKWFNQGTFNSLIFGKETPVQHQYSPLVAGENVEFYNQERSEMETVLADEFICAKDIADGVIVEALPNIEKLLQIFNENTKFEDFIWGKEIDTTDIVGELVKATKGYYKDKKGCDLRQIHVEPVFIEAMESLVDILTDRLDDRLEGRL